MNAPTRQSGTSPSAWPGIIAIACIIASSAWILWAMNASFDWPLTLLQIFLASLIALVVAGSMGIDSINIFMPLAQLSLGIQGLILGHQHFGWPGAIAGLLAGLILSPIVAVLATILFLGLLTLCSGSPRVPSDAPPDDPTDRPTFSPRG